jgi:hypothetical protein
MGRTRVRDPSMRNIDAEFTVQGCATVHPYITAPCANHLNASFRLRERKITGVSLLIITDHILRPTASPAALPCNT